MASILTKIMSNSCGNDNWFHGVLYICKDKCCILYLDTSCIIILSIYTVRLGMFVFSSILRRDLAPVTLVISVYIGVQPEVKPKVPFWTVYKNEAMMIN